MSVYSSDPFVWEKEQAGRAGPEAAWFLEPELCDSVRGSVHVPSVCLQGGICKYTAAGTAGCPAWVGGGVVSPCFNQEACVRRRGG